MQTSSTGTTTALSKPHLSVLDKLRGIAILLVFAHHCHWWYYPGQVFPRRGHFGDFPHNFDKLIYAPLSAGWVGVALFFVISGFCIHLSHLRDANRCSGFRTFFVKRFWRIYPPYACAVLLFLAGDIFTNQIRGFPEIWRQLWTHLTLTHNFWHDTYHGINPSFWSIAVEAQLYLIYPLLWLFANRVGWGKALLAAAISEIGIRSLLMLSEPPSIRIPALISASPFAYWFSWALGAYLADKWSQGITLKIHPIWKLLTCALFMLSWFFTPLRHFDFLFASLFSFLVLASALANKDGHHESFPAQKKQDALSFIGIISYSFYLFHQPLISVFHKLQTRFNWCFGIAWMDLLILLGIALIPITVFSWATFRLLELSSMKYGKKLLES